MRNAEVRVKRQLAGAIEACSCWGQSLTDPIGGNGDEGFRRRARHSFPTPSSNIGNDDVLGQMELRLVEDPPTARAAIAKLHACYERRAESGGPHRMTHGRTRTDGKFAVDNFPDEMLGQREYVLIGGRAPRELRHDGRLARPQPISGSTP